MTEAAARATPSIALVRAMRPHQWVKNLLVFVPILLDHRLTQPEVVARGARRVRGFQPGRIRRLRAERRPRSRGGPQPSDQAPSAVRLRGALPPRGLHARARADRHLAGGRRGAGRARFPGAPAAVHRADHRLLRVPEARGGARRAVAGGTVHPPSTGGHHRERRPLLDLAPGVLHLSVPEPRVSQATRRAARRWRPIPRRPCDAEATCPGDMEWLRTMGAASAYLAVLVLALYSTATRWSSSTPSRPCSSWYVHSCSSGPAGCGCWRIAGRSTKTPSSPPRATPPATSSASWCSSCCTRRSEVTPITIRPGRSWGRYPTARHSRVLPARWRDQPPALGDVPEPLLPSGCGRSYGDSGLNADGALLDATGLDRFIEFGDDGLLRCEAGVTLAEILDLVVPRGWCPPGGAGHPVGDGGWRHRERHPREESPPPGDLRDPRDPARAGALLGRADRVHGGGEPELFAATVGGLGLTGLILWAEIRLQRVAGPGIEDGADPVRRTRRSSSRSRPRMRSTSTPWPGWTACAGGGDWVAECISGVHMAHGRRAGVLSPVEPRVRVPCDAPSALLNRLTISVFNAA